MGNVSEDSGLLKRSVLTKIASWLGIPREIPGDVYRAAQRHL